MKVVINEEKLKVNNGEEFELPEMTVKKHEALLKKMATEREKLPAAEYTKLLQKEMVLVCLKEVDNTVTEEALQTLHPTKFNRLADVVWEAGNTEDDSKFRIGEGQEKGFLKRKNKKETK